MHGSGIAGIQTHYSLALAHIYNKTFIQLIIYN